RRIDRSGRNLVRDAPSDRRRLARAGTREDADRSAHGVRGAPLLSVQAVERVHQRTVARLPAANVPRLERVGVVLKPHTGPNSPANHMVLSRELAPKYAPELWERSRKCVSGRGCTGVEPTPSSPDACWG